VLAVAENGSLCRRDRTMTEAYRALAGRTPTAVGARRRAHDRRSGPDHLAAIRGDRGPVLRRSRQPSGLNLHDVCDAVVGELDAFADTFERIADDDS
jgi:hypothetical protein